MQLRFLETRLSGVEGALAENVPRTPPGMGDYAEQAGETELLPALLI